MMKERPMGFIRTVIVMGLGYLVMKTMKRAIENLEAQKVKVKSAAEQAQVQMPKLKLDPVTGVYRPEA
jgi:prefoldin subunit 5